MLILTGSEVDGNTEVLCSVCHQVVGEFTSQEIWELCLNLNAVYCFDCDAVGVDSVHLSLVGEDGRYFLWFDGVCRSINLLQEVRLKDKLITLRDNRIANLYEHLIHIFGG